MLKSVFITGVVLGLAAVTGGAGFYPLIDHLRLDSRTQALPNGGRGENFLIRLPVDRIVGVGTEGLSLGAVGFPAGLELPVTLAAQPLQIDHFKVRDTTGNVIGVAARHFVALEDTAAVAWSITIPSRGSLWLTGAVDPQSVDTAVSGIGYQPGESWSGDLELFMGDAAESGLARGGSDEFGGLAGTYTERWNVTGIGDAGELRGTIALNTIMYRSP